MATNLQKKYMYGAKYSPLMTFSEFDAENGELFMEYYKEKYPELRLDDDCDNDIILSQGYIDNIGEMILDIMEELYTKYINQEILRVEPSEVDRAKSQAIHTVGVCMKIKDREPMMIIKFDDDEKMEEMLIDCYTEYLFLTNRDAYSF